MTCPARDRLELHAESALPEDESRVVAAHAASCESCAGILRRLEEESAALRRNLPAHSVPPGLEERVAASVLAGPRPAAVRFGPLVAALAVAAALLLGLLIGSASGRREPVEDPRIAQTVRAFLSAGLPGRAADALPEGAEPLRLEVAVALDKTGEAARALEILDAVPVPADPARYFRTKVEIAVRRFEREALVDGRIPAPFEPAPFRLERERVPEIAAMSKVAARMVRAAAEARDHRVDLGPAARPAALALAVQYALGEIPYSKLPALDDPEVRYRVGELLYRERQFDRALSAWKPIVESDPRAYRSVAQLAALQAHCPSTVRVLDAGARALLGKFPKIDAEEDGAAAALFRAAKPGSLREIAPVVESGNPVVPAEAARFEEQLYLLTEFDRFVFAETPRAFTTFKPVRLLLRTAFGGPFRVRAWRVPDLRTLVELNEEKLVSTIAGFPLAGEWEVSGPPLSADLAKVSEQEIEIGLREPGLFAITAEARYCPVAAVAKVAISDTGLLQQVLQDRIVVYAAHRATGVPAAGVPIRGKIVGSYELRPADLQAEPGADPDEFRRGFEAAWAGKPSEPLPTPSYGAGFGRATDLRRDHPKHESGFSGAASTDGLISVAAPAWKPGYTYEIASWIDDGRSPAKTETRWAGGAGRMIKALVYSDRPVYRPGDLVRFKGLLRVVEASGLAPFDGTETVVEFQAHGRTFAARSLKVSEFGTFSGEIDLPADFEPGHVSMTLNQASPGGSFEVLEYRKPDYEVAFRHPAEVRAGADVEIEVQTRFHSGDPVPGATVRIRVEEYAAAASVLARDLAASWYYAEARPRREGAAVSSHELKTGPDGRARLRLPTPPRGARTFVLAAEAVDASHRRVRGFSSFDCRGAAAGVQIHPDRPCYFPGETARLRFTAPGIASIRVEEDVEEKDRFQATLVPDASGAAVVDYRIPETPRSLRLGLRDGETWEYSDFPLAVIARPAPADSSLAIRVDRPLYRPGETAEVTIRAGAPEQDVVLIVERGGLRDLRRVRLQNGEAKVTVPVKSEDAPNLNLLAGAIHADGFQEARAELVVPPSDRFLTLDVQTDRAEYRPGDECTAVVRVFDVAGRDVPDCEVSLAVVDEAIFAVKADATPDLREWLHRYRTEARINSSWFQLRPLSSLVIWKTPVFVRGMESFFEAMGIGGGSGGRYGGRLGGKKNLVARGGGASPAEPPSGRPRMDFVDTAFWSAHLKTGPDGSVTVKFRLPDNLTSFRFTARGVTKDSRIGEIRQNATVRKEFFVRLAMPRLLQEGDSAVVAAFVHNGTDREQAVKCAFQCALPWRVQGGESPRIPAGGVARVEYLVHADRVLPEAALEFSATGEGIQDAVRQTLPVKTFGAPFSDGRSGSVTAGRTRDEVLRIPDGARRETLRLDLKLDPGIHAAVLEGVERLVDYPYGCTEQTLSRFVPALAVRQAFGPGVKHRVLDRLPDVLAASLQRLHVLRHPDGGWGWWEKDPSDPGMTAYVLFGLSRLARCGVPVDRRTVDGAAAWLRSHGLTRGRWAHAPASPRLSTAVLAAVALAEHEAAFKAGSAESRRIVASIADSEEPRPQIEDAALALACLRIGLVEAAGRRATRATATPPADVATASWMVQLQVARGEDASEGVRHLLEHRGSGGWRSTQEGAFALFALAEVLARSGAGAYAPGRLSVRVNGHAAAEVDLPAGPDAAFDGRISIAEPTPGAWGDRAVVRLSFEGKGTAFYTVALRGLVQAEQSAALSRGLTLRRSYFRLTPDGWARASSGLRAGDVVLVHLEVESPVDRRFLRLTDPRPAGFEALPGFVAPRNVETSVVPTDVVDASALVPGWMEELRAVRGDRRAESAVAIRALKRILSERRFATKAGSGLTGIAASHAQAHVAHGDGATHFFVEALAAGTSHFLYAAGVEQAGHLNVGAAEAEPMYDPEVRGTSDCARLTVADGRAVASESGGPAALAPGVAGLAAVVEALEASEAAVDADLVLQMLEGSPRIGSVLLRAIEAAPAGVRESWMLGMPATAAAGLEPAERVDAAAADSETRRLAAEALIRADAKLAESWRPLLEKALTDGSLAELVFTGVKPGGPVDGALRWAAADRAFRLEALARLQELRGTSALSGEEIRPVRVPDLQRKLAPSRPDSEESTRWRLAQRAPDGTWKAAEFVERLQADLAIRIGGKPPAEGSVTVAGGTVSQALDDWLAPQGLYWRVRGGELLIGKLEDLVR